MMVKTGRLAAVFVIAALAGVWVTAQGPAHDFRPDTTFSGSTLTGWHTLGSSQWKAQSGELIGTASGPAGGWLVLDTSYQDLNFFARFRCTGECRTGVIFRLEKNAEGMTGVYVSLNAGELSTFRPTLDAEGRETRREPLRGVGAFIRTVPPPPPGAAPPAAGIVSR